MMPLGAGRPRPAALSRWRCAVVSLGIAAAGAAAAGPPPESPYRIALDLRPAIQALGTDDLFEREPAETLLVALGAAALPALEHALEAEPEAVRVGVVEVLEQIDSDEVSSLLLESLERDRSPAVRRAAILALGPLADPRARGPIEAALRDESPAIVAAAAEACAFVCRSSEALDRIVARALEAEPAVQMSVPRLSLRRMLADPERSALAREAIERAASSRLESASPGQRIRLALLLADARDPRAAGLLARALEPGAAEWLRVQALLALGEVGDAAAAKRVAGRRARLETRALQAAACRALERLAEREVDGAREAAERCSGASAKTPPRKRP